MKRFSCKKILAMILALTIVMTLAPMAIAAETSDTVVGDGGKWEQYCKATIVSDGTDTTLTLDFFDRNYDGFTGDYSAQLQNLIPRAVDTYNTNHGTTLTGESINKLVVTVNEGFSLHLASFIGFLTSATYGSYAANLTELDLSGATFRNIRSYELGTKTDDKTIGNNIFAVYEGSSNFPKLKVLKLGKGHEKIGGSAFNYMTSLEEVVIPDNYTEILSVAFKGCTSLKSLDIPAGINTLAAATSILNGCTAVEKISYHGEAVSLFDTIMGYINLSTVTKVDLSGSGITNTNAISVLNKTNLTYLNISDCNNIEYQSEEGMNLYEKLVALEATGAEVLAPVNPDPDKKADTVKGDGGKWDNTTTARIKVDGEETILTLEYSNNFDSQTGDYTPKLQELIPRAVETYNTNHGTELDNASINKLVVAVKEGHSLLFQEFMGFLTSATYGSYAANLTELDLSGATFRIRRSYEDESKETKTIPVGYFAIYESNSNFPKLKVLKLGKGLEIIGGSAFNNMTSLEEIVIPDNYTAIWSSAFKGCSSLKSLDIPDSVNYIMNGSNVTSGCTSLEAVSYHGTAAGSEDEAAFYTELLKIANNESVKSVDLSRSGISTANALTVANKTTLTSLDISNCTNIDWSSDIGKALYSQIKTLISDGVEVRFTASPDLDIYTNANKNTGQIIVDGDTVELILYNANHCNQTVYDELTDGAIVNYNFNHASASVTEADITKVTVESAENAYVLQTFSGFLKTSIPQVKEIDMSKANVYKANYYSETEYPVATHANVFQDSYFGEYGQNKEITYFTSLKKVVLPEKLTNMGNYTFMNCHALEEVVLPNALETTGSNTFAWCENLKTITVTNGTFPRYTFQNVSLENIIFVGGENDVFELSETTGNGFSSAATVYCASASAYENGIGTNLKTLIKKIAYLGDMAYVTVTSEKDESGYFIPTAEGKRFRGWETVADNAVSAVWSATSNVLGDANGDGAIDILDIVHLKKYCAGVIAEINNYLEMVDLEGDGISAKEIVVTRKTLLGIK